MKSAKLKLLVIGYVGLTLAAFGVAIAVLLTYTPTEDTMGPIQKIFYLHLPLAINTFVAAMVTFVASLGFLWQRKGWWDDLASAAARVAVLFCTGVLLTGMIWGRSAWGQWWTWSPRLTFSLMLWLLYAVYLMVRTSVESHQRRATVCAVYAIIAFLDVPLVWLSARLMPDIHPSSIQLVSSMKLTLGLWFVPVTLASIGMISAGFVLQKSLREAGRRVPDSISHPPRLPARGGVA